MSTGKTGLTSSGLGAYSLPSIHDSPVVSFHPSARGEAARRSMLIEAATGTLEGVLVGYYARPILRWLATDPSSATATPLAESLLCVVGGCIAGFHLPLALGYPNRRTNVEGRVVVQSGFLLVDAAAMATFGLLAVKGDASGLRRDRMVFLTGLVGAFGVFRWWMNWGQEGYLGAWKEEKEEERKQL